MRDILAAAATLGLTIYWGSRGASLRLSTPDRSEAVSVAWTFLAGDQWYGARHVTLGVDPATLATTPSVRPAVETFIARVAAIEGGKPTPGSLQAYTFEPAVVPRVKEALIGALDSLVQATQGT